MSSHKWNEQEIIYLKNHYYTKPVKEIAETLNLKYQQVVSKASNLGMNKKNHTGETWTKEEDSFLKENFEYASKAYLERALPKRSWNGIYQRGRLTLKLNRETQDKYFINHNSFSIWNEHTAYIVGFLLADGYIKYKSGERNENSLQVELAGYDVDILEKIKHYMQFEGPIRRSKRDTVVISVSNTKIIEDILSIGYPPADKTSDAVWIESVPDELVHHFVRGLFDGDGSIYGKDGKPCIQFLGNKNLIENIVKSVPSKKKTYHYRGESGSDIYVGQYSSKKDTKNIYDWMYKDATIFLQRKYDKFQEFLWPN